MTGKTLSSRVARVQTTTTLAALVLVVVGSYFTATALLTYKSDQFLETTLEQVSGYLPSGSGRAPDWAWIALEIQEHGPSDTRVEVRDERGALRVGFGPGPELANLGAGCVDQAARRVCAGRWGGFLVLAARDRSDDTAVRGQFMAAVVSVCVIAALLVALTSRRVAARALRPLVELGARVARVKPGEGGRVDLRTSLQEIDALAERFDELVRRFEEALQREKRFSAEASHELRTPLTLARAEVEALRVRVGRGADRALHALDRLTALIEALLWFAKAQGRLDDERMDLVNLADVARTLVAELGSGESEGRFSCALPDEALVRGDEHLVTRALANLLENALKHGDPSTVEVVLTRTAGWSTLSITNGGSVPVAFREEIFLPFVRGSSEGDGFGLGLPFARAVARAHGGDVEIRDRVEQRTELRLLLPLVSWHESEAGSAPG
jgi:signal transduction histidine kinase